MSKITYVPVRGNSYPVKEKLKALGARWNGDEKCWMVPESKLAAAHALVGLSAGRAAADYSCFRPTGEQGALLSFLQAGSRNLFIEAGAGCGKTTTALWLLSHLRGRKCMVAFNTDIKQDIAAKAPEGVEVLTMNALGFRALTAAYGARGVKVDSDYAFTLFKEIYGVDKVRDEFRYFAGAAKLYDLARGALATTDEDVEILSADHELSFLDENTGEDRAKQAVALVLAVMSDRAEGTMMPEGLDFTDQMWLPVVRGLTMPKFDVLVIDEAQDTNALQVEMLARCADKGARVIAVGDRRQAIYRFRGADSRAVDAIVERFDMAVMPLMTTFRCAKAIVAEAQRIVPQFQAGEHNPEGIVRTISIEALSSQARPGDFVISRSNAPLIAGCIATLASGVRATVVGRDIGEDLLKLARKFKAKTMEEFYNRLEAWKLQQIEKLSRRVPVREAAIEAVEDKVACLEALASDCTRVESLYTRCETLFTDASSEPRIEFTSTHKAKGRERNRVFLLSDTFCRARKDRKTGEWMEPSEEEFNLLYVAITRAKAELVYVEGETGRKGRR